MENVRLILIILFSFFININSYSQLSRFQYKYKMVLDSSNKSQIDTSIYNLDIDSKTSIFYKNLNTLTEKQIFKNMNLEFIQKEYDSKKTMQSVNLGQNYFLVLDDRKLIWNLQPEKDIYLGFTIQKAKINFMGRDWIAWFTTDIPIQDGPYKFHGLPGLILKIYDNTNSHSFELIAVEKHKLKNFPLDKNKYIKVSYKKFKKLYQENIDNPIKKIIGVEILETDDGISGNEFKRRMNEYYKRQFRRENNILEIDLLKK